MPPQFPNSDPAAATPKATPFDSILAQCRDLVCERLGQALSGMLDNVDAALSALIIETRDPKVKKIYADTREKALKQRDSIEKQFRARYLREFQERSNRVKKIGDSFAEIDLSSLELELVGDDDLNETLQFNAMAAKVRQYCDEELIALDQRMGVLLGDASLQAEDNPFTPQAICDAYKDTCRQLDSNVEVRMVLLRLFDDHVLDDIRAVYKAVNSLLVQNSILPKIRISARREGDKAPPPRTKPAAETPKPVAQAEPKAPDGEQDLFSILKNLRTNNLKETTPMGAVPGTSAQGAVVMPGIAPAAGMSGAGMDGMRAVLQGTELLGLLTRIQLGDVSGVTGGGSLPMPARGGEPVVANVLRELKETSVGSGMNQLDMMTLDIMSLVFDQLFDDPKIPVGVKGLIGRLQIPMLKVAIADKTFFSKKTHPARQLLDTLGEVSLRLPADFNAASPLFGRLETVLQELIDGFEDKMEIFDVARGRLETLIAEEDQRVEQQTKAAANQIEQNERLALAKTVAQAEIKARVRVADVPRPVIEFLAQQWVQLLLVVHVTEGEESVAWKTALETMDLLIWSVEPKNSTEERRDLAAIVPELLRGLAAGLRAASVEDAIRSSFFADLKKFHTELIGMPAVDTVTEPQDAKLADTIEQPAFTSSAEPESAPAMEPATVPVAMSESAPAPELASAPAMEAAPAPIAKSESTPAFELAAIPDLEIVPASDEKPETVPASEPALVSATELTPAPVARSGPERAEASAAVPDLEFLLAPSAELTPAPAMELVPAPVAKSAPAPASEPVSVPDLEFTAAPAPKSESAPASELASAPATQPTLVPDLEFVLAPEAKPVPAAAAQAAPVPDLDFNLAAATESKASPAGENTALPDLEFVPAPPVPPHVAKPEPAPAAEFVPLPDLNFAPAPTAQPVPPPAAKPAASPPVQPPQAPIAKSAPVPVAKSASVSAAQSAPVPGARSAPAPAARPVPTPAAKPAIAAGVKPATATQPASAAKPVSAPGVRPTPARAAGVRPVPTSSRTPRLPSQAMPEDLNSLDFTAPVTVQNPFGGGKVQVEALDFAPKPAAGKREAVVAELPGGLAVGIWVGIREKGEKDPRKSAKLSYVSPLKTRYLFVDRQGKTVLDCTRTDLARRFQSGDVMIMDEVPEVPLFERITGGLVGKLGGAKPK